MEYLIISKSLAVKGIIDFKKENLYGLEPDTPVLQIGNGKENGCIRTDYFVKPFYYVGSFIGINDDGDCKYYAFRIPEDMLPKKSEPHYLLYEDTGHELCRHRKDYTRFLKPIFKTA